MRTAQARKYLADRGCSATTQTAGFITSIAVQLIVAISAAVVARLILYWIGVFI